MMSEPLFSGKLLLNIDDLAELLSRSVPSLRRDDAAGRLPTPVKLGGSKKWNRLLILDWVEQGCPARVPSTGKSGGRK